MNITEIYDALIKAKKPDGSLAFNGKLVSDTAVSKLLSDCFYSTKGDVNLSGTDIRQSDDKKQVLVHGNVAYPAVTDSTPYTCSTGITISVNDKGAVIILLKLTLADGWDFKGLFPGLTDMPFNRMQVKGAFIIVSTEKYHDDTYDVDLDKGMSLAGMLQLDKGFEFLVSMLNDTKQVPLYGTVTNASKNLMSLTTKPLEGKVINTPLKEASLTVTVTALEEKEGLSPYVIASSVSGKMPIGSKPDQEGEFTLELTPGLSLVSIETKFNDTTLNDFASLVPFIGSGDPLSVLPAPIQGAIHKAGNFFLLKELALQFDYKQKKFPQAAARIGINLGKDGLQLFPPIPAIVLKQLDFMVNYNGTNFTYSAETEIDLGSYKIILTLQTEPDNGYVLYIKQSDDTPLKLKDIVTTLLPDLQGFPDLEVTKLELVIAPPLKQYSLDLVIKNQWEVPGGSGIKLDEVDIEASYNGELTPAFRGKVTGVFSLIPDQNDRKKDIQLYLQAEKGESWKFSGYTGKDQLIPVGSLIQSLVNKFKADAKVPDCIKELVLENVAMSFDTKVDEFKFSCELKFPVGETKVDMFVDIDVIPNKEKKFGGIIIIDRFQFALKFDMTPDSKIFVASYVAKEGDPATISIRKLVKAVAPSIADSIPDIQIQLEDVKFVYYKKGTVSQFAFGVDLNASINLSDLPVIGKKLPADTKAGVKDLAVLYASAAFTKEQAGVINKLLPEKVIPFAAEGFPKGTAVAGKLFVATYEFPINTGNKKEQPKKLSVESFVGKLSAENGDAVVPSPITWFNVDKQLGPFKFNRIGIEYQDNVLSFALDAALAMGPATLGMQGLSMGSSLSKFSPVFGLDGFSLDINTGSLEVGGAFQKAKTPEGATAYYGMVIIKFGSFGIKALGGDVPAHEAQDPDYPNDPKKKIKIPASFFIYANVQAPLGGPPFLYLNGFAGGFGINNSLKLPTLENLPGYILLPGPGSKAPAEGKTPAGTIGTVLPQMQKYFVPQPGQYWMAAGIAFSSFQMINAFALITVSFGVDFQVGLLGSASMNFPTGAPKPIAYIEIDIMASYSTSSGLFAVEGIVSPASYIFGDFCKITGGFAFYIWINPPVKEGGPKAGDFVVTLGGYHPAFKPPSYYPKVPRLGINFSLGPFQVTGGCYFALTPGMFMAGASMKAVWDVEIVKAWFIIGADFLIAWAPFHYEAGVYVSMGCSVNLGLFTINVSVGADLYIWGPPFGGRADVDLDVISFTIHFGSKEQEPEAIDWKQFKEKFLPSDSKKQQPAPHMLTAMAATLKSNDNDATETNVLKSTVPTGLNGTDVDGFNWILDPDHFIIQVSTNIPVNNPLWTTASGVTKEISNKFTDYNGSPIGNWPYLVYKGKKFSDTEVWNPKVNVKPMKVNNAKSTLTIVVMKSNESGVYDSYVTSVLVEPVVQNAVAALWAPSTDNKPAVNDPSYQQSSLIGFKVKPLPRIPNMVYGVRLIMLLYQQGNIYYFNYQQARVDSNYKVKMKGRDTDKYTIEVSGQKVADLVNENYVLKSLVDPWVASQRTGILANLRATGFSTYEEVNLKTFAKDTALTNWPVAMLLGDSFPS